MKKPTVEVIPSKRGEIYKKYCFDFSSKWKNG